MVDTNISVYIDWTLWPLIILYTKRGDKNGYFYNVYWFLV